MKKQRQKPKASKKKAGSAAPVAKKGMERRDVLRLARTGAIGLGAVGVAGFFGLRSFQAHAAEHDLSRIGNGVPMVVQIHDPQCALCRTLQGEARAALKGFDVDDLQYVVANIRTPEGRALASQHGVPHVTLLLMDGRGRVQDVIRGVTNRDILKGAFADHIRVRRS